MGGFYYVTIRPALTPTPRNLNKRLTEDYRPPEVPPPPLPAPKIDVPTLPLPLPSAVTPVARRDDRVPLRMEVPVQDRAKIDFSNGAPVVNSTLEEQAALDKTVKEMLEAAKNVQFPPSAEKK